MLSLFCSAATQLPNKSWAHCGPRSKCYDVAVAVATSYRINHHRLDEINSLAGSIAYADCSPNTVPADCSDKIINTRNAAAAPRSTNNQNCFACNTSWRSRSHWHGCSWLVSCHAWLSMCALHNQPYESISTKEQIPHLHHHEPVSCQYQRLHHLATDTLVGRQEHHRPNFMSNHNAVHKHHNNEP